MKSIINSILMCFASIFLIIVGMIELKDPYYFNNSAIVIRSLPVLSIITGCFELLWLSIKNIDFDKKQ